MATLDIRLQNDGYVMFLKTGICLYDMKEGLEEFCGAKSRELQHAVTSSLANKGNPSANGLCPTARLSHSRNRWCIKCGSVGVQCSNCLNCSQFIGEIQNYCSPAFPVDSLNWRNSDCTGWPEPDRHWELGKLFIKAKNPDPKFPEDTDVTGILNFVGNCSLASRCVTATIRIKEVIEIRNKLMHLPRPEMNDIQFTQDHDDILALLEDIYSDYNSEEIRVAIWKIKKVKSPDFRIKPNHEFAIMRERITTVQLENEKLLAEVMTLKEKCKELETIQEELYMVLKLEIDNEISSKQRDQDELKQRFEYMQELVKGDGDLLGDMKSRIDTVQTSLRTVDRELTYVVKSCRKVDEDRGALGLVVGASTGALIGSAAGPVGALVGGAVGGACGFVLGKSVKK